MSIFKKTNTKYVVVTKVTLINDRKGWWSKIKKVIKLQNKFKRGIVVEDSGEELVLKEYVDFEESYEKYKKGLDQTDSLVPVIMQYGKGITEAKAKRYVRDFVRISTKSELNKG